MDSRASMSCFSNTTTSEMYLATTRDEVVSSSLPPVDPHVSSSLLYNLSVLQEKVHQIQSFVGVLISPAPDAHHQFEQTASLAISSIESLVQEIIPAASSMVFTCQQLALSSNNNSIGSNNDTALQNHQLSFLDHSYPRNNYRFQESNLVRESEPLAYSSQDMQNLDCYGGNKYAVSNHPGLVTNSAKNKEETCKKDFDIVEIGAEDLLAKYTHYCKICGKGFKRDANLRMHMRAHGDQYKTVEALTNPMKRDNKVNPEDEQIDPMEPRKGYSCPQQGCRWNQRHEKFQPLKSIICVKNHYKRSHCPKMYVCKRCNVKQFSVLSDLRTHEKHCGDVKWVCSCRTRFSRKDKLLGHVGLFAGHFPVDSSSSAVLKRMKVDDD